MPNNGYLMACVYGFGAAAIPFFIVPSAGDVSIQELPMRYADFGVLHRNEVSERHRTD